MLRRRSAAGLTGLALSVTTLLAGAAPASAGPGLDQYLKPVPASAFSYSTGAGASVGSSAVLWANGSATAFVTLAQPVTRFVFSVKAAQCEGSPRLQVAFDGVTSMSRDVAGSGRYALPANLGAGRHQLTLRLRNDKLTATCDRNLTFRQLGFEGPRVTGPVPVQVWQDFDPGAAAISPFSAGTSDPVPTLWSNGTVTARLDSQGARYFYVGVRVTECQGRPRLTARVDGEVLVDEVVGKPEFGAPVYSVVATTVPNGMHTVSVSMSEDLRTATCDRSMRIEMIRFFGEV